MKGLAMVRCHCAIGDCSSALSRLAFSRSQSNEFSMRSVPLMPNVWRSSALIPLGTQSTPSARPLGTDLTHRETGKMMLWWKVTNHSLPSTAPTSKIPEVSSCR